MSIKQRISASAAAAALTVGLFAPMASMAMNDAAPANQNYASYSVEQLESLISKLQKMVEELKKGSVCFVSDKELSLGDGEGDDLSADVRRLQDFLREKGLYTYKSTGYFGKMTRTSLVAYQKSAGVSETGIFDTATRAKAHASYCRVAKKPVTEVKKENKEQKEKTEQKNYEMNGVSSVKSISLKAEGQYAVWSIEGNAPQGFKVAWSKTSGVTYPPRASGDNVAYYGHPDARKAALHAFDGAGTYFVRVCEYIGGKAGTCSNEIQVTL